MKMCIMALEDELLVSLILVLSLSGSSNLRHIHTTIVAMSII